MLLFAKMIIRGDIMVFLQNFLFQILFSVGLIIIFGFLIAALNRSWCRMLGSKGMFAMRATGVIGTPIHEIGHAIFCIIFGHKIVEMKLYSMDTSTGVLGYVNHSYNKKNIYHVIGNFFIGVGPIIFGSLVLMLLMWLLIPATFVKVFSSLGQVSELSFDVFNLDTYAQMGAMFLNTVTSIFSFSNFGSWQWWVFIVLGILIATHMTLSKADVDGSKLGFVILLLIYLIVDGIIFLISPSLLIAMTSVIVKFSFYILSLLMLGIIVLLLLLILTFVLGGFKLRRNY